MISEPIFLVGSERSGTTVLRLMLAHHPQIAWCQEFEYAVDRVSDDGNFPNLKSTMNGWKLIESFRQQVLQLIAV